MNNKRKDVHLTGALAAVLNAGEVTSVEEKVERKKTMVAPSLLESQDYAKLFFISDYIRPLMKRRNTWKHL